MELVSRKKFDIDLLMYNLNYCFSHDNVLINKKNYFEIMDFLMKNKGKYVPTRTIEKLLKIHESLIETKKEFVDTFDFNIDENYLEFYEDDVLINFIINNKPSRLFYVILKSLNIELLKNGNSDFIEKYVSNFASLEFVNFTVDEVVEVYNSLKSNVSRSVFLCGMDRRNVELFKDFILKIEIDEKFVEALTCFRNDNLIKVLIDKKIKLNNKSFVKYFKNYRVDVFRYKILFDVLELPLYNKGLENFLIYATESMNKELVKYLIEEKGMNVKYPYYWALKKSILNEEKDIFDYFIEKGFNKGFTVKDFDTFISGYKYSEIEKIYYRSKL